MTFPFFASLRRLLALASAFFAVAAGAQVNVDAPEPLNELLGRYLKSPSPEARGAALEAFSRDARRSTTKLLATEGYFSPEIEVRTEPGEIFVTVAPGPRTVVSDVAIEIRGDISPERRADLLSAWPLKQAEPFRDAAWREAKQLLLRQLMAVDFPAATLLDSRVEIDPTVATATLHVVYDTGPRYVFNGLSVTGLSRYSTRLIEGYSKIRPGSRYDQKELLALQGALQRTPYFTSASVDIAQPENPPEQGPVRAPVRVHVQETPPHRLSFGTGFSTNTGAQGDVIYRGLIFLRHPLQLETGLRLEEVRQRLYSDVHLPPEGDRRDSFGALTEHENIAGLRRRRGALAAVRNQVRGSVQARYAVSWQREIHEPDNAPASTNSALTLDGSWTVRQVNDPLNPRRGFVAQVQAGGGSKALHSDQDFFRVYTRYQHYFPMAERDVLTLRGELGATLAPSRAGIPGEFLFRTGGSQSVRGYRYQGLGVKEGDAVAGGRYLATASAEYTHWLSAHWGVATFIDVGDAADSRNALDMAVGYGLGARWKSPAGPLAADLAYGERDGKLRLHFSLAVAF